MDASLPLDSGIENNAVLYRSPHTSQPLPQIIHILHFYLLDLLRNVISITGVSSGCL